MQLTKNFDINEFKKPLIIADSGFSRKFEITTNQFTMTNLHEIWKDIPEYEGFYQASNLGRIKSLSRIVKTKNNKTKTNKERLLKSHNNKGYAYIILCKYGKPKSEKVHRLVLSAFNGKSNLHVNHLDGNKENNKPENLEYCTNKQNRDHALRTGLHFTNLILDTQTGVCYNGVTELAKLYNIGRSGLNAKLLGRRKNNTQFQIV